MAETFRAMVIDEADGKAKGAFRDLSLADLPDHGVLVEVTYSTVNYKDGLAVTGKGRIARRLPMVAGLDLAGTVVESADPAFRPGDEVIVNGWGLSETEWGGYARYARLKPEWLTRRPEGFTLEQTMAIGTAGYTAALAVRALEDWGRIGKGGGEVLVTGAAGGVGSVAIALLARRGYTVTAATGRPETHDYLAELGATGFVARAALAEKGGPLQKERWAGAVDSVGSTTLANVLAQTVRDGAVAACGLAGGADLPATVMPHILRGVALLGIDSVMARHDKRDAAWAMLDESLDRGLLARMTRTEPLSRIAELAEEIVAGRIRGRVVIDIAS
ncbi:MDR family oxidoreductase [Ensifer soli]|uniref:MDR family oxidoreductase n=1 Tax=Ciceribacter sp. sgz301302 TaxID=3342379 RepID=UPI0035BA5AA4